MLTFFRQRPIEFGVVFKSLGVHFFKDSSGNRHIYYINTKLARIREPVNGQRYRLPSKVKLLLYNSLILSPLNHCHLVWGTTTKHNLNKLLISAKEICHNRG